MLFVLSTRVVDKYQKVALHSEAFAMLLIIPHIFYSTGFKCFNQRKVFLDDIYPATMEIPFVGREKELQELHSGMKSVKDGHGRLYFITGPVGIGKTRLIQEVCKIGENEGFTVLFGRCLDEKAVPYLPIIDVLERHAKNSEAEAYTPLGLIGAGTETPGIETSANASREKTRVLEAYLRKLQEISQTSPVVFVLDDLQWADTGTLSFVHYLSRAIFSMKVLALIGYPEEYLRAGANTSFANTIQNINIERNCMSIALAPLRVNDVSVILGAILGTWKLPKELVSEIHERTGGNPLFVEEVGRAILEQDLFDINTRNLKVSIDDIKLPSTVKSIISQRISRFDEDTKKVLRACAILGRVFEYEAVKNTVEMDEEQLLDILDKLIAMGYIEQTSGNAEMYKFVHNPVYEVIYTETSGPRRRLMHRKAGIELEKLHGNEKKYFSELGRHFLLGGEMQKGIEYKIKAGEYALSNYASEDCLRNIIDAERVIGELKDETLKKDYSLQIYRMLGDCYSILCDFDSAISAYLRALNIAVDQRTKVNFMVKLSYPYMEKGDFDRSLETLQNALNMVSKDDRAMQSEILRNMGWVYERKGDYARAVDKYRTSVELAEASGDEIALGEAYHRLGTGLWFIGDLKKAREYLEKGLEIRKKHNLKDGIASSYNNIALVLSDMGEIQKAIEYYGLAKKIFEDVGDLSGVVRTYNNLGRIYSLMGENEQALEFFRNDIEISKRIGDKLSILLGEANIGQIYQENEEYNTALEYYKDAIKLSKELQEMRLYAGVLAHMATVYAEIGDLQVAMEKADEAIKVAEETRGKDLIGEAYMAMGDILRRFKKFEEAESYYKKALDIYTEIDILDSRYAAFVGLAGVYIDWKRYDIARKLLEEAKEFFTKIGAKESLKKIEKEFGRIKNAEGT